MRFIARAVRGTATVLLAGTVIVTAASTSAYAGDKDNGKGNGKGSSSSANSDCGEYCSTRDGSPSGNGNGDGKATGRPCAGCVGKADDKNPKGQRPNGSDSNNGYECDGNSGIARSNPAHTGCTPQPVVADEEPVAGPVETPVVAPEVVVTDPVVQTGPRAVVEGVKIERLPVAVKAPAELPEAAVAAQGDTLAPHVLGTRFERQASGPGAGSLPVTGGTTAGLLLAAVALAGMGVVLTRAGSAKA